MTDRKSLLGNGFVVRLETLAHGARVRRLWVDTASGPRNVVLGHASAADYAAAGDFMGATVGRYANRIASAGFDLGDRRYPLSANENGNTLHGGADAFSDRVWAVTAETANRVEYTLVSPDGDQGFPGTLTATSTYEVRPDGVDLEFTATTDATTVVSLTNHAYFNLAGDGSGTVDGHRLTVPASRYTQAGPGLLPTGAVEPVDGTPLDLRRPTRIGDAVRRGHPQLAAARGIDHNLVPDGEGLRLVAKLEVDDLALTIESDAPVLQVYTGNFLDGSLTGIEGHPYRQGDGICLEPQAFPDTPNRPEFGSVLLDPGQVFRRRIRWTFTA
jgi:aldose 1-epimerase